MNFWFVVSALLLLSVAIVAYVVLRQVIGQTDAHHQRIVRNVKLYQRRLQSLEDELSQDFISQENYDSLYNELSRQLLNDVSQLEHAPVESHERQKWLLLIIPVPLLALFIYGAIGAYPDWLITQELTAFSESASIEEYQQHVDELQQLIEKRLQQKPDHIDYRNMLAQLAMGKKDYAQAALHYGMLSELLPEDADVLADYVQAEYMRNGRKITPEVAQAMDKALRINPLQTTILSIQGVDALAEGDLQAAIDAWEKLITVLPPHSEESQLIREGIKKARQELGLPAKEEAPVAGATGGGVTVTVSLDQSLPELDGNIPVFVFATAVSGPAMPLAVKKIRVKDLPATITLDDSMAMMPEMQLSKFDKIKLVARVALSGGAIASSGDWQGEVLDVSWKEAKNIEVIVSELVK